MKYLIWSVSFPINVALFLFDFIIVTFVNFLGILFLPLNTMSKIENSLIEIKRESVNR